MYGYAKNITFNFLGVNVINQSIKFFTIFLLAFNVFAGGDDRDQEYYEALDEAFFEGIEISSITEVDLYTQYSFIFVSELSNANKDILLPKEFILNQNYPNPFNPATTLSYTLPENSFVNVHVFDMLGRTVKILVSEMQTAGSRVLRWNATDAAGSTVSAGIYLYMIQAGDFRQTKKMVLLK